VVSTPRRPLPRPQPATPTLFATIAPQQRSQPTPAFTHQQQQVAAGRQQPALWSPLVASSPSLPAGKAQGVGLLSVRKGGQLQAVTGPSASQQSSNARVAAGTPAWSPAGASLSQQQQQGSEPGVGAQPATEHTETVRPGLQEQEALGSQARLLFPPPEAPGGVGGAGVGLVAAGAGSAGSRAAAGGGGSGLQQLQHLAGTKFSSLSVRLHGELGWRLGDGRSPCGVCTW